MINNKNNPSRTSYNDQIPFPRPILKKKKFYLVVDIKLSRKKKSIDK